MNQDGRSKRANNSEYPITKGRIQAHGAGKYFQRLCSWYKGKRIAVIEAKRCDVSNRRFSQAIEYAKLLQIRYTYASNGQVYEIDIVENKQRELTDEFPSPEELWEKTYPNKMTGEIVLQVFHKAVNLNKIYQHNAIENAQAISEDKKRILLTLATGTGKTAIAFRQMETFQTNGFKRTLRSLDYQGFFSCR